MKSLDHPLLSYLAAGPRLNLAINSVMTLPSDQIFLLEEGELELIYDQPQPLRTERTVAFAFDGDVVNPEAMFESERQITIRCNTFCRLRARPYEALRMKSHFGSFEHYCRDLLQDRMNFCWEIDQLKSEATGLAIQRVLYHLAERSPKTRVSELGVQVHTSRIRISNIVGCSREIVGRVLTEFGRRGITTGQQGKWVELINPEKAA